jgi:hypothetical protein
MRMGTFEAIRSHMRNGLSPWIRALGGIDWRKNRGSKISCNSNTSHKLKRLKNIHQCSREHLELDIIMFMPQHRLFWSHLVCVVGTGDEAEQSGQRVWSRIGNLSHLNRNRCVLRNQSRITIQRERVRSRCRSRISFPRQIILIMLWANVERKCKKKLH